MSIFLLIFVGVVAGVLSGLGIGGGVILIPALTMFFAQSQHAAQNINLLYFIPTAIFALIIHAKNRKIETKILPMMIVGGIIGAVAGSIIALNMQGDVLRKIFAGFLLVMGVAELAKARKQKTPQIEE
ncbi:MAG: sulfite exporter TauE/SafE family protein [Defluviitaleaceae bacterium]|nr:sulfite exporter TauE/SafE family protein [Defluviitaleaceae bacterium]